MPADFLVARNPEEGSTLPYLLRIPLGDDGIVLKSRETWPRTGKVYCHRAVGWPSDPEIVEQVPVTSCVRRGAAIDLVLARGRENRSQFVLTHVRGGREAIFWQTARTAKQARPAVAMPGARGHGQTDVEILVDSHERYAWTFKDQQVTTRKQALTAGDYAVEHAGEIVAVVERKSLVDLVGTLTSGKMRYLLAALADAPRAAVVVEDRYSQVFSLDRVRPAVVADALGECHARFPQVPIVFTETRPLAQQWTYRFFTAALREARSDVVALERAYDFTSARPATPGEIRAWALANGFDISSRGRIPADVVRAFEARSG